MFLTSFVSPSQEESSEPPESGLTASATGSTVQMQIFAGGKNVV